ncbi:dihydroorotate dehydrogenase electron transfer subunit [Chloroflexota bacterium]
MIQTSAIVTDNRQVLKELIHRRDLSRPQPRDILGSWIIRMDCPDIAREVQPGQYVMVHCGDNTILPRPFSIHKVNKNEILIFYGVKDGGKGTNWLSQREEGDEIRLFGPLGNGFEIYPDSRSLLLVAGGTGIAPLYFLSDYGLKNGYRVTLCIGSSGETKPSGDKNPSQIYPSTLLPAGIQVSTITSSANGKTGMVTELIPDYIEKTDQVFACGPVNMYRAMARMPELENKRVQVSMEIMMGCGRGICYGCTIETVNGLKKVCEDGPVFDLNDILWD